jgi:hypothetical protein
MVAPFLKRKSRSFPQAHHKPASTLSAGLRDIDYFFVFAHGDCWEFG